MQEVTKINVEKAAETLRNAITEAVQKFMDDTDKTPGVSVEIRQTETRVGVLTKVNVEINVGL